MVSLGEKQKITSLYGPLHIVSTINKQYLVCKIERILSRPITILQYWHSLKSSYIVPYSYIWAFYLPSVRRQSRVAQHFDASIN